MEAGSRKQEAGSRKQEAGSRKQEAGSRKQEAGSRKLSLKFNFPPNFFLKRFSLGVLCAFVLSVVLSACDASQSVGGLTETTYGAVTVSFHKNNRDPGSTEAKPDSITVTPPATTLGTLPEEPTRPGHKFVEWNTAENGQGTRFDENTPVNANIFMIVYAKWEPLPAPPPALPQLGVEVVPGTITFTPIDGKSTFNFTVSGFKNETDANSVGLNTNIEELPWLSLQFEKIHVSVNTKTFVIRVDYRGPAFSEAPAKLNLNLKNIPAGYEYSGGTQSLRIALIDGRDKTHPIPVNKDNLKTFNDYASTEGLARHYRLTEDVELDPPAPTKSTNWTVIGTFVDWDNNSPFVGSFDGGNNTISGLTLVSPDDDHQGLFGFIAEGAEIKNLVLTKLNIHGNDSVGGVVGKSIDGIVENCAVTGNASVTGSLYVGGVVGWNQELMMMGMGTVQRCYSTGDVTGFQYVGGIVGTNAGTVQSSYATGKVTGDDAFVGGLVGLNNGTVQNNYATGSVKGALWVGGLVGGSSGTAATVQNSYATGSVEGLWQGVGGLLGNHDEEFTLKNCVALNPSVTTTADNSTNLGRVVGQNNNPTVLSNNHARDDMVILSHFNADTNQGTEKPIPIDSLSTSVDGAHVYAEQYGNSSFWKQLHIGEPDSPNYLSWDFKNVWDWGEGNLPILRDVGGKQNHSVQPLPP